MLSSGAHRRKLIGLWALALLTPAMAADIELPGENLQLRQSTLPGFEIAVGKCGICHSADYIAYQPPGMTQAQWTAEMTKMQHLYGAPISDDEVALLAAYLATAYGHNDSRKVNP
jgi:mono/diheme cytochrome c family protein